MKVSGFTFVKNAILYGYPVVESIRSLLPLVDEMIVCLGDSEDDTNGLIASIGSEKIRMIHSVWDDSLREGGAVLAAETNKALAATQPNSDWLFYIQADEVVHEKDYAAIREAMQQNLDDKRVDGLLFRYHHFYGSYGFIGDGRRWYSREIRIIKNNKQIQSFKDAQGFRWADGQKLRVKPANAFIYHYGWVRNPLVMNRKEKNFFKLWDGDAARNREVKEMEFDYSNIDSVTVFSGTHPNVMQELVAAENWDSGINIRQKNFKNLKHRIFYFLAKNLGWRPFEYRNYKMIR